MVNNRRSLNLTTVLDHQRDDILLNQWLIVDTHFIDLTTEPVQLRLFLKGKVITAETDGQNTRVILPGHVHAVAETILVAVNIQCDGILFFPSLHNNSHVVPLVVDQLGLAVDVANPTGVKPQHAFAHENGLRARAPVLGRLGNKSTIILSLDERRPGEAGVGVQLEFLVEVAQPGVTLKQQSLALNALGQNHSLVKNVVVVAGGILSGIFLVLELEVGNQTDLCRPFIYDREIGHLAGHFAGIVTNNHLVLARRLGAQVLQQQA